MPGLTDDHAAYLEAHAIDVDVARRLGVHSATTVDELPEPLRYLGDDAVPAVVFPWTFGDRVVHQVRPDKPVVDLDGKPSKYLFTSRAHGGGSTLWTVHEPDGASKGVLLVEGTKQALAVASLSPDWVVHALAGCAGWFTDGVPIEELDGLAEGRDLAVILDADMTSNPAVHDAARRILDTMGTVTGARSVKVASTPGARDTGIDDLLATRQPGRRAAVLESVISSASATLPRKPASKSKPVDGPLGGAFLDGEFQPFDAARIMDTERPVAIHEDAGVLYQYNEATGAYVRVVDLGADLADMLRNAYRQSYVEQLAGCMTAVARSAGRYIDPLGTPSPLVPVANGVLNPATGELSPHDPKHLLLGAWPTPWEPDAECPRILDYIDRHFPDQRDPLLDTACRILERCHPQDRALFLFGPPRSAKSTLLRLLEELVGAQARSAETLHDLSSSTWSTAELLGKSLNVAADISSAELQDTARFKAATGGDVLSAQRKYEQLFTFTNHALLAFSANTVPTLPAEGGAELARFVPVAAPVSFLGHEDPRVEAELMKELPGLLAELVRRFQAGNPPLPLPVVLDEFRRRSDRVFRFVGEWLEPMPPGTPAIRGTEAGKVFERFARWADDDGSRAMSRPKFYEGLRHAGIAVERSNGTRVMATIRATPNPDGSYDAWVRKVNGEELAPELGLDTLDTSPEKVWPENELQQVRARKPGEEKFSDSTVQSVQPLVDETKTARVLDIETGDAAEMWTADYPFIRLVGLEDADGAVEVSTDASTVLTAAEAGHTLVAHNGFGFDFPALAHHAGLDLLALGDADQLIDSRALALIVDPPDGETKRKRYDLDSLAERFDVPGKSDDLKKLAKEFGGFHLIPTDDERYRSYLEGDVRATRAVVDHLPMSEYAKREMRGLARLVTGITVEGFRVDVAECTRRRDEGAALTAAKLQGLVAEYGLPTTKADGSPAGKPLATKDGKEAIARAFADLGIELPTAGSGAPSLAKQTMQDVVDQTDPGDPAHDLASSVLAINGERSVYQTTLDHLDASGERVHPKVDPRQTSGRMSITEPGLTVFGKRGGRHVEREIFLPEPGHVMLAADMSQIDSRAVAALSECPDYAERFADDRDLHQEVADALGLADREDAKPFSHGFPYGLGVNGMVRGGLDRDLSERYVEFMHDTFPRLCEWMTETRAHAESGELLDNGFGRLMRATEGREYTQAPALLGQGCARDLMLEAVLHLPVEVVPMMRAFIHDEFVFSVPESDIDEVRAAVLDAMSFNFRGIAIKGEAEKTGRTWGEVYRK